MAIPESQLETWSNQGATIGSRNTYRSIRTALSQHSWPIGMHYQIYLQGSYANYTNIRGNSDVDLVIELDSVFASNLNTVEKQQLGIEKASYGFDGFRHDVEKALTSYYGEDFVDVSGRKSIKIAASSNRLAADVVPCITYKRYHAGILVAKGITFWTVNPFEQIINYPRVHRKNGSEKNRKTGNRFKPSVRIFKNARDRILEKYLLLKGKYPSYFIECLLYNVPQGRFSNSHSNTFCDVVGFLESENADFSRFCCQNEQLPLFGEKSTQWDIEEAVDFVHQLHILWEQW